MLNLAGRVLAVSCLAACGVHSTLECTDRIPCPSGMECSPEGICVLILPEDGPVDSRVGIDGPDAAGVCGDRACLGDETCVSCRADCGDCPFECGDGACEAGRGEDCVVCPVDCGTCPECDHGPCEPGGPLDPGCDPCAATVCSLDPFCCTGVWDEICVQEAQVLCPGGCASRCGDGVCAPDGTETCETCRADCGPCGECAHGLCTTGGPLDPDCDPCVATICGFDPFCCAGAWDDVCRSEASAFCGIPCGMGCGDGTCSGFDGETCATCPDDCGPCLGCGDGACDPFTGEDCFSCATDCGPCPMTCGDGFCDPFFSGESCLNCQIDCGPCAMCGDGACGPSETECTCAVDCGMCSCAHDLCTTGSRLDPSCDECAGLVCSFDPFCCAASWDETCVQEVTFLCGQPCGGGFCGDFTCDPSAGESCSTCPSDCGPCPPGCGDGNCQAGMGETCASCPADCGMCGACVDQDLSGPLPLVTTGSTVGRGNEQGGASCGDGGGSAPDVVFRWSAPAAGTFRFTTVGSSFDTILYARATDCSGAILACNDDAPTGGLHSVFQLSMAAGQTIVLILDGFGASQGSYSLRIEPVTMGTCGDGACSSGESCSSCPTDCGPCPTCVDFALPSSVPVSATGTTLGAGNQQMGGCGDTSAPEHVYEYVPPLSGTYRIDTVGSFYDTLIYVRIGDCSGPQLGCNDDIIPGVDTDSQLVLPLEAGVRVVVVVDGWASSAGSYQLHIDLEGMSGCGDGACAPGEDCSSCPTDCGPCAMCGDGFCDMWAGESCERCPADCGICPPVCGNGTCDAGEGCTTCPGDCGTCPGACGNGVCGAGETCSSCPSDCGTCGGTCTHDVCLEGAPLMAGCSSCVTTVCSSDPFCCSGQWDELCVDEARTLCGEPCARACPDGTCGRGETCSTCDADCGACPCPHDVCSEGAPMTPSCSPCVSTVCAADPFCCSSSWDDRCIAEAQALCGVACGGFCGDFSCGPGESCANCPTDCGSCTTCGDGFCSGSESCTTCPRDCGPCGGLCGDFICDMALGERCDTCPTDCGPCGGFCGDMVCDPSFGEFCDTCPQDCGSCSFCGDGACGDGEHCLNCAPDCGTCLGQCGDGECVPQQLEFCFTCPSDCPCP